MIDVIIATCKSLSTLKDQIVELLDKGNYNVIPTCQVGSAAYNRNYGLDKSQSDIVIMIDDDVFGLRSGWAERLTSPLSDFSVLAVSARLMGKKINGIMDYSKPGLMTCQNYNLDQPLLEVGYLPTTCVAFRKTELRFHEGFRGSGFEDTHFFWQMEKNNPGGKFFICNHVRVNHKNEQKSQKEYWAANAALFKKLTGGAKWHG